MPDDSKMEIFRRGPRVPIPAFGIAQSGTSCGFAIASPTVLPYHALSCVETRPSRLRINENERLHQMNDQFNQDVEALSRQEYAGASQALRGIAEDTVMRKVVKFYARVDELMQPSDAAIACAAGCSSCCHSHVMASPVEIFAIVEHLRSQGDAVVEETIEKLRAYIALTSGLTRLEHIRTRTPCVLLQDGQCSAYAVRPIACRGHHSADASVCQRVFDDPASEESAPMFHDRIVIASAFDNLAIAIQHQSKLDTTNYEFHGALLDALTNPSCFKRWKRGKSAFPNVKDRSNAEEAAA